MAHPISPFSKIFWAVLEIHISVIARPQALAGSDMAIHGFWIAALRSQ
jgi:hypothetical protein